MSSCSSAFCFDGRFVAELFTDERELIPTGASMQRISDLGCATLSHLSLTSDLRNLSNLRILTSAPRLDG